MSGEGTGELPLESEQKQGEPGPAPQARGAYTKRQAEYCGVYGVSLKTIKNWISEGKDAHKLPPLDHPQQMPGWWTLVHPKRSVPSHILAASETARRAAAPAPAPASTVPVVSLSSAPSPRPPSSHAVGYAASLDRLRSAEADAYAAYEASKTFRNTDGEIDFGAIEQARRIWNETAEQLRMQEAQAAKVLEKAGELLPANEVRTMLMQLHAPIVSGLRSLYLRILTKAGNITLADAKQHFDVEINRMLRELISSEFSPPADA